MLSHREAVQGKQNDRVSWGGMEKEKEEEGEAEGEIMKMESNRNTAEFLRSEGREERHTGHSQDF